jgi:hypothetical protein
LEKNGDRENGGKIVVVVETRESLGAKNSRRRKPKILEMSLKKNLWGRPLIKINKVSMVSLSQNGVYATLSSAGGKMTGSDVLPASPYVSAPTWGIMLYFNE